MKTGESGSVPAFVRLPGDEYVSWEKASRQDLVDGLDLERAECEAEYGSRIQAIEAALAGRVPFGPRT